MAKVKVYLQPEESPQEFEDLLFKALDAKRNSLGQGDDFNDPAMDSVAEFLFKAHSDMLNEVVTEVGKLFEAKGKV